MASYTMELREYIEMWSQNDSSLTTKERIEIGRQKLFDFEYPIFDANYKKVFETNFIRKFYMREIGYETEALFKFQLESWMLINMPYFNKMFESELIQFDPLENSNVSSTAKKNVDTTQNGSSSGSTTNDKTDDDFSRQLISNNPDTRLTITTEDGKGVIEYASSIIENNSNNKTTVTGNTNDESTNDINSVEDYVQSRSGKIGSQSYSKMLQDFRKTFIRIENEMFNEMQQLFMLVY